MPLFQGLSQVTCPSHILARVACANQPRVKHISNARYTFAVDGLRFRAVQRGNYGILVTYGHAMFLASTDAQGWQKTCNPCRYRGFIRAHRLSFGLVTERLS